MIYHYNNYNEQSNDEYPELQVQLSGDIHFPFDIPEHDNGSNDGFE
jgi:hypothetical protein